MVYETIIEYCALSLEKKKPEDSEDSMGAYWVVSIKGKKRIMIKTHDILYEISFKENRQKLLLIFKQFLRYFEMWQKITTFICMLFVLDLMEFLKIDKIGDNLQNIDLISVLEI